MTLHWSMETLWSTCATGAHIVSLFNRKRTAYSWLAPSDMHFFPVRASWPDHICKWELVLKIVTWIQSSLKSKSDGRTWTLSIQTNTMVAQRVSCWCEARTKGTAHQTNLFYEFSVLSHECSMSSSDFSVITITHKAHRKALNTSYITQQLSWMWEQSNILTSFHHCNTSCSTSIK